MNKGQIQIQGSYEFIKSTESDFNNLHETLNEETVIVDTNENMKSKVNFVLIFIKVSV